MKKPSDHYKPFDKLLIANRGEIAIRIGRAAAELGIHTVGIYTHEDRQSLHRYKMDEAYQIGADDEPLKPYLDIEGIIQIAKLTGAGAIHPGYGFLSENPNLARRCYQEGIVFVGPLPETLEILGDKVKAKQVGRKANVPLIPESEVPLTDVKTALSEAERIGYPVMLKAASGGGGRGMRKCPDAKTLEEVFQSARNEAGKAFGDDTVFLEKFIINPKHIEVQILGDSHGQVVHLFERDCSVQRRFQKVVEFAPAESISESIKNRLYDYALVIARSVGYINAGTVEFLVDAKDNVYFIEVNPRIQVEHTVTEEVTKIDLVPFTDFNCTGQSDVRLIGCAIQCRVTTEDPENDFKPDFGTISHYRNASGFSIRLDEGSSYPGMRISPYFDSLLVKVTASGTGFNRCLRAPQPRSAGIQNQRRQNEYRFSA
ncbi:hypothetical protein CHS0354_027388 [Potamilus streckersoni]|uniref:Pyruvate carboxylase n=1 Tax=Potamilus streckersoni TaxID=2493646 RepID=A0AAE0SQK1_9BIVA|nr:hypothetical protein CHS0354_027388 [Potamilus streckersoni]